VTHDPLTGVTFTIAAILVAKTSGDRERMTAEERIHSAAITNQASLEAHGGIRVRSLLDPQPGQFGFFKAVSTVVQCSPLRRHEPVAERALEYSTLKTDVELYRSGGTCMGWMLVSTKSVLRAETWTHAIAPMRGPCET
jgi:hypothetical protein